MLAPTQRRRVWYYLSFPLVATIMLVAVAKLVALERAEIIAKLADRIAHSDSQDAATAVRQLAAMPNAPVAILVSAATSADRQVADEAKHSIGRLLRRAQRQIEAGRRVRRVARQLEDLAEALAAHHKQFSPASDAWLSNTTSKVLRLSNHIPSQQTPLLAVHCDAVLASIAARDAKTKIANRTPAGDGAWIADGPIEIHDTTANQVNLQDELPPVDVGPVEPIVRNASQREEEENESPQDQTAIDPPAQLSVEDLESSPWRGNWSQPVFRTTPVQPIHSPPADNDDQPRQESKQVLPPDHLEQLDRPLAELDSRDVLRRWVAADGSEIWPLEEELTRRGFGRVSERFVDRFFSPNKADRSALIDDILTEPGVDARPWLILLSEDPDADVRLLAVTIMAASNDSALVEKAWQVSIRDRDTRIAALAGKLRERRSETAR